jgi:hypothetical protein
VPANFNAQLELSTAGNQFTGSADFRMLEAVLCGAVQNIRS